MEWTKRGRKFLNTPSSECLAAVSWSATLEKHWNQEKYPGRLGFNASMTLTREACEYWISNKRDLKALYNMRDELNKFIETCEQGLADVCDSQDNK